MSKMIKLFSVSFTIFLFAVAVKAQNPLPDFVVETLGMEHIRIAWANPFAEGCVQVSVQKSYDSLRNFRTFFSTPSPELPQNGIVDNSPAYGNTRVFYRIFYVLEGGAYYFTKSKIATTGATTELSQQQLITIQLNGEVIAQLDYDNYKKFRDSVFAKTRDNLITINQSEVILKRYIGETAWAPSPYVFTSREGYVNVKLPDTKNKKYKLVIFDSDGKKIFNISKINEPDLILDKASFMHAGWFNFELYENEILKEKNKFYLQREF